jgi:hypothetical protein
MAVKLEVHLREQHSIHQVHSLVNDLSHFLVHAHDNKLVDCTFKSFFVNVLGKVVAYLLQCLLSVLPLWTLQPRHNAFFEELD